MEQNLEQNRAPQKRRKGGRYAAKPTRAGKTGKKKAVKRARRIHGRWTLGRILLLMIPVAAVIAASVIAFLMVDMGNTYTFEDSGIQYYAGVESPVIRGSQMKLQDDGSTLMIQDGQSAPTQLPVYLDGSSAIVSSVDMTYYAPRTLSSNRLLHFSTVLCRENGTIVMSRDSKQNNLPGGFLHDGADLYVFLEPMAVEFDGYRMEVPALSYVDAVYKGYITVFDYSTRESYVYRSNGKATAQAMSGEFTISLYGDSMTRLDGKKHLMIARPELMDPL